MVRNDAPATREKPQQLKKAGKMATHVITVPVFNRWPTKDCIGHQIEMSIDIGNETMVTRRTVSSEQSKGNVGVIFEGVDLAFQHMNLFRQPSSCTPSGLFS
ncbi:hypothetical protein PVK06_023366 [Gossypium arboreum]|uniref:Uncharacterized protein n=1 Tax=Gossypium arboreum TaxID=29729 RepID=A0ABR0PBC6_GOSAR|nr:hypothetical protein PVK06_023366 [Gossypium arboreum]